MRSLLRTGMAATALLAATGPVAAQVVRGTVSDSASKQPVAGAQVMALSAEATPAGRAVTGQAGEFAFRLPAPGTYRLHVSRLGYSPRITQPIGVDSTFEANVQLWLTPVAVPLDTVNVVAEDVLVEKRLGYLVDVGFYDRQHWGFGLFITRARIDSVMPQVVSDLFYGISGVRVVCARSRSCDLLMPAATTMFHRGTCLPSVVLDGVVIRAGGISGGLGLDDLLNPFNIEAIEVYRSPAGTRPVFRLPEPLRGHHRLVPAVSAAAATLFDFERGDVIR